MSTGTSLADGNRFQRAYHRWAEPHYRRMAPEQREQAELIDRFLYSRRGLLVWAGLAAALTGSSLGLVRTGLPAGLAVGASVLVWIGLPLMALAAWLQPAGFTGSRMRRTAPRIIALALAGALLGFAVGDGARAGSLDLSRLLDRLWQARYFLLAAVLLTSLAVLVLMGGVAQVRRQILERQLQQLRLQHERDTATREAVQAQLRVLQLQIQPHFIFNTLSAVQHWVDGGDPRAPGLLRALTAFLRGSTEALGRERVTLAEETALVRHYLTVMQARLGERLDWSVDLADRLAEVALPPGLLLTLVENAIEHGISASLAGGALRLTAVQEGDAVVVRVRDSAGLWGPRCDEGVGLRNSRARLQHRYGDAASLTLDHDAGDTVATLRLPLGAATEVGT